MSSGVAVAASLTEYHRHLAPVDPMGIDDNLQGGSLVENFGVDD
jgi:hypothetical protein